MLSLNLILALAPLTSLAAWPGTAREEAPSLNSWTPALDWEEEFSSRLAQARLEYVDGLEELAAWCHSSGAYAQRNLALEGILHFAPDDAKARKSLRYRRDRKANAWVRRSDFHEPRDGSAEDVAVYEERRAKLDAALAEATIETVEAYEENLGPGRTYRELRDLAALIPQNHRLLRRLGFVQREVEGEDPVWVTRFTNEAPARRAKMAEWLSSARDAASAIEEVAPTEFDSQIELDWKQTLRSGRIRLLGRVDQDEAEDALRAGATSAGFLSRLVGEKPDADYKWTLYVLESDYDMKRFVASYPDLDEDQRRRARNLGSLWLPGKTRCGIWGPDREMRVDMSCKQVAVRFIDTQFGVKPKRGWLVDGLGLYINQHVVGTRLSRHVTITDYVKPGEVPLTQGLEDPGADWLAIAERCLSSFTDQEFARALGRNTNEMTAEDVVVGYALVAYLCEGAGPESLRSVLENVGSETSSSVAALESWFELPLFEIRLRFLAWLREVPPTEESER